MGFSINTLGHLLLDGVDTGLGVRHTPAETLVFWRNRVGETPGLVSGEWVSPIVPLPHRRYALASEDEEATDLPSKDEFERDVREILARTKKDP